MSFRLPSLLQRSGTGRSVKLQYEDAMSEFPKWARHRLGRPNAQVSHGLNLVLELRSPANELPLLLWDIVLAQDKIKQALEGLSFVHFARFIPSWDGRALMVTTEFDGPLDPYVLDFVIALGDVFDTLLSYVKQKPPVPVRKYPDEFLAWVRRWNRVPFSLRSESTLFPEGCDYPLYSAYPDKTVTDVAGRRRQVPPPAIDHPAAAVDLADVQGNILRGYRPRNACYLFFSVTDSTEARHWLAQNLPQSDALWKGISSAAPWTAPPEVLTQVAFTCEGLSKLLPPARQAELANFPIAFKQGAEKRAAANFDEGDSAPGQWIFGRADQAIHVVLFLYSKTEPSPAAFLAAVAALENGQAKGLKLLDKLAGTWLAGGKEPFGFADGISDPAISGQCPGVEPAYQPAAGPGEFLLHQDYASIFGGRSLGEMPQRLAGNGSFGVLRLMEQDVELFKKSTDEQAAKLKMDPERLRAKLVGRWKNGAPLALAPDNDKQAGPVNDFDYAPSWEFPSQINDHWGLRCPVGAHIRRANPRTARVAGERYSRRLLRRGLPAIWKENGVGKVGLMGLFLGASIERQFEFIQRQWLQGDLAASGIRGTKDAIASIRTSTTQFRFLEPHPDGPGFSAHCYVADIPPLIRTRGCLYVFFPGLAALRTLDATSSSVVGAVAERDCGGVAGANARSDYDGLLQVQELQDLADGKWQGIILDLTERRLDSPWVRRIIASFAPPTWKVQPPADIPVADFDLANPRFLASPFEELERLRTAGNRIVWVPAQQACWVLDYAGCQDLLGRNKDFQQAPLSTPLRGIATLDDPRHIVVRQAYEDGFGAALNAITPNIHSIVAKIVTDLTSQTNLRQFDYMGAFAHPVARTVLWQLIGITEPAEQRACDALADTMVLNYGRTAQAGAVGSIVSADAALRLSARLIWPLSDAWLDSFKAKPSYKGTLIGELAARMGPGLPLPHNRPLGFIETLLTLVQTVLASQSPHFLLGSAALNLFLPDPRQPNGSPTPWSVLAGLAGNPGAFDPALALALDEARRFEPPLTLLERYANGAQSICGVWVPDGCPVFAMVASANRDATFGPQPEEFHYNRPEASKHLSLGYGIHLCAGRFLQEALLPAALGGIIRAMPELRLSNPMAVPSWHATIYFRVLQALSVTRCPP